MKFKTIEEILSGLNKEQRTAVDAIEGPVMVVAGPGTGKTQILASRIANIIATGSGEPENILCLTFTEAGALAMRKRLESFIGSAAHNVGIFTFHGLCNQIIQENSMYFGLTGLKPVSELEKRELVRKLIDKIPIDSPLKRVRGERYYDAPALLKLFTLMKAEDLSVAAVAELADAHSQSLEENPAFIYQRNGNGYKKGDLKKSLIDKERADMEKLKAAAGLYDAFQKMMLAESRYDFVDMILWVIRAFDESPDLLLNYQEKYQYFLVDEYQDTNGSQNHLLMQLATSELWKEKPNVFVVGDDDQSIYRFQGANIGNIKEFYQKYEKNIVVEVLTQNYRSSQAILDAAGQLIIQNTERISPEGKVLKAASAEVGSLTDMPVLVEYFDELQEAVDIGARIIRQIESGVKANDIAVLYRNHSQADMIMRYLKGRNVPVSIKKNTDALLHPLVEKVLLLLDYISLESGRPGSGEHLLFAILHLEFYHLNPSEIARLAIELRGSRSEIAWREALQKIAKGPVQHGLFSEHNHREEIRRLASDLEYWIREVHNAAVPVLLEKVVTRGGILASVLESPNQLEEMQVLRSFFSFVKEECEREPYLKLNALLERLHLMRKEKIEIPVNLWKERADGVNFMSAHGSKGLEFDHVYIIGAEASVWEKADGSLPFGLGRVYTSLNAEGSNIEESRRLFYVALTRARRSVMVSWYTSKESGKKVERTRFATELEEKEQCVLLKPETDMKATAAFAAEIMTEEQLPPVQTPDMQLVEKALQSFVLSATSLSSYLRCPVGFYYDNLLRIPSAKNAAMSFGTAMHAAIEAYFRRMLRDEQKEFPAPEFALREFEKSLAAQRESFTEAEYSDRLQYGQKLLSDYLTVRLPQWEKEKTVTVERNIFNVQVDGIPIKGKIDKIVFEGNEATVVDYKTGNPERARTKLSRPVENASELDKFEARFGGDYWRQLVFYYLLVEADKSKEWRMRDALLDFMEPAKPGSGEFDQQYYVVIPEDVEILKDQLKMAWNGIQSHQFSEGCGECAWCDFNRFYLKDRCYAEVSIPAPVDENIN